MIVYLQVCELTFICDHFILIFIWYDNYSNSWFELTWTEALHVSELFWWKLLSSSAFHIYVFSRTKEPILAKLYTKHSLGEI